MESILVKHYVSLITDFITLSEKPYTGNEETLDKLGNFEKEINKTWSEINTNNFFEFGRNYLSKFVGVPFHMIVIDSFEKYHTKAEYFSILPWIFHRLYEDYLLGNNKEYIAYFCSVWNNK